MCLVRVARGSKVVQGVVEVGELRCLVPQEGQEASVETARVQVAVGSNLCLQRARRGEKGCCGGAGAGLHGMVESGMQRREMWLPGVLSHHAIDELQQDGGLGRGQEAGDGEEEIHERELPLARERLVGARRREGGAAVRRRRGQASANVAEPRRHRGRSLSAWLQRPPGRAPPPRSVAPAGDISGVVAGGGKEGGLGLALAPPLCSRTGSPCSV